MPLDHYVTLGRSGLRVSPLCLGTMTFGLDWGWGSDPPSSVAILDAYIEKGGNFIDTANIYTKGHAEAIIGDRLAQSPALRDRLVIATKCTGNMHPGDPNAGGGGRKNILRAVDDSLRRLKTDSIDLLWAHFFDAHTPIEETLHTFDVLIQQGKARYVGLSDHPAWVCAHAHHVCHHYGWHRVSAIQIEYSLIERSVEAELIPMARHLGMGLTPWSPLKGGILSGKYTRDKVKQDQGRGAAWERKIDERMFRIIDELTAVAAEAGCSPAQAALAWVQRRPGVTSSIIGARTLDQLHANLDALDLDLPGHLIERLDTASAMPMAFPHDFLRNIPAVIQGGTTVNGDTRPLWDLAPKSDAERW